LEERKRIMNENSMEHAKFKVDSHSAELPYGQTTISADFSDAEVRVLLPPRPPTASDPQAVACAALENPCGTSRLRELTRSGDKIVIAIPDVTRPCPTAQLLRLVLQELKEAGVSDESILIVSGLGSHRPQSETERAKLVGQEIFGRVRCVDSDRTRVTFVGQTSRGTPVDVFTPVIEADKRICIGVIEYHYFAGFSGGYKALVPAMCPESTIEANHGWMVQPGAESGRLEGNPVRADIDEAGKLVGADFILNVILDDEQRVIAAVAGDPIAAHRQGCSLLTGFGRPALPWFADVVLVSAGGFPKDLNLYQAQKALDNARLAVREGGTIILVAECPEGLGHGTFGEWMMSGQTPDQLIDRIRAKFVLGGHKAAAIALARKRARISLVSRFSDDQARTMGFEPYASVRDALAAAALLYGNRMRMAVMPLGGSVLPQVQARAISAASQ
jgi:nickel-dependent lactate racemase